MEYRTCTGTQCNFTYDTDDSRINGWFETQNLASLAKRKITMSEFCDYVLRQVICTSTTRKAAWSELDSLYKNMKDISDCHVLAVKIKQLVNLIYPTDAVNVEVEAAPCTHREIIMSLYNLTISLRVTVGETESFRRVRCGL